MPNLVFLALIIAMKFMTKRIVGYKSGHVLIYSMSSPLLLHVALHTFALHSFAFSMTDEDKMSNIRLENTANQ